MDRTRAHDVEADVGTETGAILVCATNRIVRTDLASVLRQDYPVRTAGSESDAVASIDRSITVLVVDDETFSLDRIVEARSDCDGRFQIAAIAEGTPTQRLDDRCDGFVRKPVDDRELRSTVRLLHRRSRYDETLAAYYALSEEYARLVTNPDANESDRRSLEQRLTQLRAEVDDIGDALGDEDALQVALDGENDRSDER